jgi:hypothetical protein
MRRIKNYQTGETFWTKPMRLPRTVRGQMDFLKDLQRRMMLDFTDKDHVIYNSEYGWGRDAKGIDKQQVVSWFQSCMEKQARSKKTGTRASWRNLWLMDSPVYMWFMGRKAWWGICLDCDVGTVRRREMYSMMAARKPGKWLTAPGTCLKCAKEQAGV